jgi:hypothetical protein
LYWSHEGTGLPFAKLLPLPLAWLLLMAVTSRPRAAVPPQEGHSVTGR